jgi:hypothetical protein
MKREAFRKTQEAGLTDWRQALGPVAVGRETRGLVDGLRGLFRRAMSCVGEEERPARGRCRPNGIRRPRANPKAGNSTVRRAQPVDGASATNPRIPIESRSYAEGDRSFRLGDGVARVRRVRTLSDSSWPGCRARARRAIAWGSSPQCWEEFEEACRSCGSQSGEHTHGGMPNTMGERRRIWVGIRKPSGNPDGTREFLRLVPGGINKMRIWTVKAIRSNLPEP